VDASLSHHSFGACPTNHPACPGSEEDHRSRNERSHHWNQVFTVQFNDYSHENPNMTFEEVVLKEFGPDLFPGTPQGRLFGKECREMFDREREAT